jgi:hypothetical protein
MLLGLSTHPSSYHRITVQTWSVIMQRTQPLGSRNILTLVLTGGNFFEAQQAAQCVRIECKRIKLLLSIQIPSVHFLTLIEK